MCGNKIGKVINIYNANGFLLQEIIEKSLIRYYNNHVE